MVDDQLASAFEYLAEALPAVLAFEDVILLDRFPRQLAALRAELIAEASELLLLGQVLLPSRHPIAVPDHPVRCHLALL